MSFQRIAIQAIATTLLASGASAGFGYTLSPKVEGQAVRELSWGETFTIDINVSLTGDTMPEFNSAIFQVRFTEPGLELEDYAWDTPFGTGDIFDDSTPSTLNLPAVLDSDTFDTPLAPSLVDIDLSNISIAGSYATGDVVSLTITVPANFGYAGALFVSVAPDTLADGFNELPASSGQVLQLNIIPAPATAATMLLGGMCFGRRRR